MTLWVCVCYFSGVGFLASEPSQSEITEMVLDGKRTNLPVLSEDQRQLVIREIRLIAESASPIARRLKYDQYLIALNDRETIEDYLEQFREEEEPGELLYVSKALSYATDPALVTEFEPYLAFGDGNVGVLYGGDAHVSKKPFQAGEAIAGIFTHSEGYPAPVQEWGRRQKDFGSRRTNIALMRWFEENREHLENGEYGKVSTPIDPLKLPEHLAGWAKRQPEEAAEQPQPEPGPDTEVSEEAPEEADATANLGLMGAVAVLVVLVLALGWFRFRKGGDPDKP